MTTTDGMRERIMTCASVDLTEVTQGRESTFYIDDLMETVAALVDEARREAMERQGNDLYKRIKKLVETVVGENPEVLHALGEQFRISREEIDRLPAVNDKKND